MQLLISTICLALTSVVIGNAYLQKKQFYPAVVYITKSNASMAVIYVQFFVIVFMFGKLLRKIFLGTLRAAEFEHLLERFWYALTETCLAFTVFRDDFNPRFVALFTVLLFLKSFHWLAEERVDFMERSPVLGWLFHIRVASLLALLGLLDYVLLMHAYESTLVRGPTVQLVFGFEYAILLTVIASTAIKYVLHAAEMRTDTPWENKAVFLLYTELVIGLIKVILYVLFVVIMTKVYALPMFVFRPMFFTIRNFKKALSDVIMSRRAIRNMNTLYPDATPEELRLSDNICIICREDMINHSKKLPCGHIFHTTCLRSWFQRQQTCPTCRLNILRSPRPSSTAMPRPDEAVGGAGNAVPAAAGVAAAGVPGAATAQPGPIPPVAPITTEPLRTDNSTASAANNSLPNSIPPFPNAPNFQGMPMVPPPFMMPPPFQFITPYAVPPPPMPHDLTSFTDEELRLYEGNERKNIEERIKLLKNIRLMLDSVDILMNNYQLITSRIQTTTATVGATTATAQTHSSPIATTQGNVISDGPSTSAAARTQINNDLGASPKVASVNASLSNKVDDADNGVTIPSSKTQPPLGKHNEVTIEDIGGEEHDYIAKNNEKPTSTSTFILPSNASSNDNSELNELRKRRLKYLEELNASSTTHTDAPSE